MLLLMPLLIACGFVTSSACAQCGCNLPTPDSAHQTSGLLQVGAVDNIFCAGDEAAATVSPYMQEMRQRESDVAAVDDLNAEEVSMMPSVLSDCHE